MDKYMIVGVDNGDTEIITFQHYKDAKIFMEENKESYINIYLCEIVERGHKI